MAANQKFWLSTCRILGIYGNSVGYARKYSKHYDPKFRVLRRKKFEAGKNRMNLRDTEKEIYIKKMSGLTPSSFNSDIPYYTGSTYEIFSPYVPKDGDGKYSSVLEKVSSSVKNVASDFTKNKIHSQRIAKYDDEFNMKEFAHRAKEIYINAHEALANKNINELMNYTTEKAFNSMANNFKNKTIKWKYIESLDPPSTVHVRVGELTSKGNAFGQVTVRFHSKQMLAIYDRFGRLMYGSEILAKDVLEYVVFERHLINVYGKWKMHDKIIPDWAPPREPVPKTYAQILESDTEDTLDPELELRRDILPETKEETNT